MYEGVEWLPGAKVGERKDTRLPSTRTIHSQALLVLPSTSLVIVWAAGVISGAHALAVVELVGWVPRILDIQQLGIVTPVAGSPV